jgi:hypothetical protein
LPFGHRHSLLGHPVPPSNWALLTVGLPNAPMARSDLDGVTAFRTHEQRPGWVPSIPRGRRCSPRTGDRAQPAPAASQRQRPITPAPTLPPAEGPLDEASTRVQAIHPSGLPLARYRPDGTGGSFGFPPSFEPRRPGAGRRTSGWGQAIEHGPGTTLYVIDLASNPACSLVACDIASHRSKRPPFRRGWSRRKAATSEAPLELRPPCFLVTTGVPRFRCAD